MKQGKLSSKQHDTVITIRKKCKAAATAFPTTKIITESVLENYDVKGDAKTKQHTAQTIASQLMDKPEFKAALGFDSDEIKEYVANEILRNIRGENPLFPKDLAVYLDSLKLAFRASFAENTKIIQAADDQYKDKTDAEHEYFIEHSHWPETACEQATTCRVLRKEKEKVQ